MVHCPRCAQPFAGNHGLAIHLARSARCRRVSANQIVDASTSPTPVPPSQTSPTAVEAPSLTCPQADPTPSTMLLDIPTSNACALFATNTVLHHFELPPYRHSAFVDIASTLQALEREHDPNANYEYGNEEGYDVQVLLFALEQHHLTTRYVRITSTCYMAPTDPQPIVLIVYEPRHWVVMIHHGELWYRWSNSRITQTFTHLQAYLDAFLMADSDSNTITCIRVTHSSTTPSIPTCDIEYCDSPATHTLACLWHHLCSFCFDGMERESLARARLDDWDVISLDEDNAHRPVLQHPNRCCPVCRGGAHDNT